MFFNCSWPLTIYEYKEVIMIICLVNFDFKECENRPLGSGFMLVLFTIYLEDPASPVTNVYSQ